MTKTDEMLLKAKTAEETRKALAAGADVNARNDIGETALMNASIAEQTKLLIEAGADVNARNEEGECHHNQRFRQLPWQPCCRWE